MQQKQVILSEINEIKQDIFDESAKSNNSIKLLGELLKHLRESKSMPLLMLCRQIKKLEIEDNIVVFYSDEDLSEIFVNERYKAEMDLFFKQKGLSYKLFEKKQEISEIDILNKMLGGKLVIE